MANYFVHDKYGYGYVLNTAPEIGNYCQLQGEQLAASTMRQSGADYIVDTQHGWTRWHTRVTVASRDAGGAWNSGYFRERSLRSMQVSLTQWGGKVGSFKLRPRAYRTSRRRRP